MMPVAKTMSLSEDDTTSTDVDLSSLTIAQLKELAAEQGYTVTKTKKADIISEIESQM